MGLKQSNILEFTDKAFCRMNEDQKDRYLYYKSRSENAATQSERDNFDREMQEMRDGVLR